MAIGFTTSAPYGNRAINPDRSLQKRSAPRTLTARFGDGYEQRATDGINNINEQYSISFVNRPSAEADDIVGYFESLGGATSFNYTISDTNESPPERTMKVVCETWNMTYTQNDCHTVTATFRRVYEA